MSDPSLTGAAVPLLISGKTFQAIAFTDRDYDELDEYIQSKVIEVAKKQLQGLSQNERSEMLQAAIKAASSSGWGTLEGNKIINTVEGSIRLGWQMIKVRHPNISWEDFLSLARKSDGQLKDNIFNIDVAFTKVNNLTIVNKDLESSKEDDSDSTKSS